MTHGTHHHCSLSPHIHYLELNQVVLISLQQSNSISAMQKFLLLRQCSTVAPWDNRLLECRAAEGERGARGQTLALAGIVSCLEMDLLMDETWPVHGLSHSAVAHDLVESGLLQALKGALTKFQGSQRLLAVQALVLIAHHPSLHSKCVPV